MSISGYGMIETRYHTGQQWFAAARVFFYGDIHVFSLLGHPWGEHTKEDEVEGRPAPVVPPRGLPSDLALMTLHEVGWIPSAEAARKKEARCIAPSRAKKFSPLSLGYVLDPKEWCCLTWLKTAEIERAKAEYIKIHSQHRCCGELEGILGMMQGYEKTGIMETRLVLWWQD